MITSFLLQNRSYYFHKGQASLSSSFHGECFRHVKETAPPSKADTTVSTMYDLQKSIPVFCTLSSQPFTTTRHLTHTTSKYCWKLDNCV